MFWGSRCDAQLAKASCRAKRYTTPTSTHIHPHTIHSLLAVAVAVLDTLHSHAARRPWVHLPLLPCRTLTCAARPALPCPALPCTPVAQKQNTIHGAAHARASQPTRAATLHLSACFAAAMGPASFCPDPGALDPITRPDKRCLAKGVGGRAGAIRWLAGAAFLIRLLQPTNQPTHKTYSHSHTSAPTHTLTHPHPHNAFARTRRHMHTLALGCLSPPSYCRFLGGALVAA